MPVKYNLFTNMVLQNTHRLKLILSYVLCNHIVVTPVKWLLRNSELANHTAAAIIHMSRRGESDQTLNITNVCKTLSVFLCQRTTTS